MKSKLERYWQQALVFAFVATVSSTAFAMRWTPGNRDNIEDCRSGWVCLTSGRVNVGSSWDHIWGPLLKGIFGGLFGGWF